MLQALRIQRLLRGIQQGGFAEVAEVIDRHRGQTAQAVNLTGGELPGLPADGAEAAEGEAVGGDQWEASVEADPGLTNHQGVIGEARILAGVRNNQRITLQDRVAAERD